MSSTLPPEFEAPHMTWPVPNYDNPDYRGPHLAVIEIILILLALVIVGTRMYARLRMSHNVGLDDWFIILALLPTIGLTATTLWGTHYGWGFHIWDNKVIWAEPSRLISWLSQFFYNLSVALTKISICFSYLRFSHTPMFKLVVYATMLVVTFWGVVYTATVIFRCRPINSYWKDATEGSSCLDENMCILSSAIINIVLDFWLCLLPLPTQWSPRLHSRHRVTLGILMSINGLACIAGITRTIYAEVILEKTFDVTWEGYTNWLWTSVECDIGIIFASFPCLGPIISIYFPHLTTTSNDDVSPNATSTPQSSASSSSSPPTDHDKEKKHGLETVVEARMEEEIPAPRPDSQITSGRLSWR